MNPINAAAGQSIIVFCRQLCEAVILMVSTHTHTPLSDKLVLPVWFDTQPLHSLEPQSDH